MVFTTVKFGWLIVQVILHNCSISYVVVGDGEAEGSLDTLPNSVLAPTADVSKSFVSGLRTLTRKFRLDKFLASH